MRYDFTTPVEYTEFSHNFFAEIDRRFFANARTYMPWKKVPFDRLIDFDALRTQDVLEIGVGNGSHAQLLAAHAKSFTGIDLTNYAVNGTSIRLAQEVLKGASCRWTPSR
jgi:2-polyprenyl-3-methyl-5-hydroxy-6-metoxy-1,4-benzoquinol methylase